MIPVSDVIPLRKTPVATIALIVANTLAFVYELTLQPYELFELGQTFGVVPAHVTLPTLITATLLHDGWIHFGGSMLYLWIFGQTLEDAMGALAYLALYLSAGAVGALIYTALHPAAMTPLVGTGTIITALLSAYFVLFPTSRVLVVVWLAVYENAIEVPAMFFVGGWFVLQLMNDLHGIGIQSADLRSSFVPHLAGLAGGGAVGMALRIKGRRWG